MVVRTLSDAVDGARVAHAGRAPFAPSALPDVAAAASLLRAHQEALDAAAEAIGRLQGALERHGAELGGTAAAYEYADTASSISSWLG